MGSVRLHLACDSPYDENNTSGINTEIEVNGQELETVTSFKYMGSVITNEGSKPKRLSMIAQNSSIDKVETSLE